MVILPDASSISEGRSTFTRTTRLLVGASTTFPLGYFKLLPLTESTTCIQGSCVVILTVMGMSDPLFINDSGRSVTVAELKL